MNIHVISDQTAFFSNIFSDIVSEVKWLPYKDFSKENKTAYYFYRFCNSPKLGHLFFKQWIKHCINRLEIKKGDVVLFENMVLRSPFWSVEILRQLKAMNCIVVFLALDSLHPNSDLGKKLIEAGNLSDLVYTYDKSFAENNNWIHTYQYYSYNTTQEHVAPKSDVFCAIYHGGRLATVVETYDVLTKKGVNCLFYISGVSNEEKNKYARKGIIYNHFLTYDQIIDHILNTHVLLDVTKKGGGGITLRPFEAIVYNKRLLTNSPVISEFPFYDNKYMQSFEKIDDVKKFDASFFTTDESVDYHYDGRFSPIHLLEDIKRRLNILD